MMDDSRRSSFPPGSGISIFPTPRVCVVCSQVESQSPISSFVVPGESNTNRLVTDTNDSFTFCHQCLTPVHKECTASIGSQSTHGWRCLECISQTIEIDPTPTPTQETSNTQISYMDTKQQRDISPPTYAQNIVSDHTIEVEMKQPEPTPIAIAAAPSTTGDDDVIMIDAPASGTAAAPVVIDVDAPPPPVDFIEGQPAYEVEKITRQRSYQGRKQFFVKWKGFPDDQSTWEPEANVEHCDALIEFRKEEAAKRAAKRLANGSGGSAKSSVPGSGNSTKAKVKRETSVDATPAAPSIHRVLSYGDAELIDSDDWRPMEHSPPPADDIPANAPTKLQGFLEFIQHNFTAENWDAMPIRSESKIEVGGIAGANVDYTSLHSLLYNCLKDKVDVSSLASVDTFQHLLSEVLTKCLENAARVRTVTKDTTSLSKSDGMLLQQGVLACTITLQILTMPNVPRPLIREDYLSAVVGLVVSILRHILLPIYDQIARDKLLSSTNHRPGQGEAEHVDWKKMEAKCRFLVQKSGDLLEQLTHLITLEKIPDLLIAQLLDASYTIFSMTPVSNTAQEIGFVNTLQSRSSMFVQKVFLFGDATTRKSILDAIVTAYRDLNPNRRNLRNYIVYQSAIKKEKGAAGGTAAPVSLTAADDDLSTAIGSSIPLPGASQLATDTPSQISVQILIALVCHLLQSVATDPLRTDDTRDSASLLDRIKSDLAQKELDQAVSAAELFAAASVGSGKKKKTKRKSGGASTDDDEAKPAAKSASKKKGKKGAKNDESEDVVMADASATTAVPMAVDIESPLVISTFNAALDTPQVRNQFIDTVTTPILRLTDYIQFFLRTLVDRIQPPVSGTGTSTINGTTSRLLFKNFIEDLLQVLFTPEFPIAEQMLTSLTALMVTIIDGNKVSGNITDRFRLACVSLVALIAIHLKRHSTLAVETAMVIRPKKELIIDESNPNPLGVETSSKDSELVSMPEEELHCICNRRLKFQGQTSEVAEREGYILDCDLCHIWYHGACIGIKSEDETPQNWHCPQCVIRLECESQTIELNRKRQKLESLVSPMKKSKGKKTKGKASISEAMDSSLSLTALTTLEESIPPLDPKEESKVGASVMKQLLINYLDRDLTKHEHEEILYARQYDLCAWMQQARLADTEASKSSGSESSSSSLHLTPSFERDLELIQINFEPPKCAATASVITTGTSTRDALTATSSLFVTREMAVRIARQLCNERQSGLLHLHQRILFSLCLRCKDASPKLRSTAVSAIADLVRVDPIILKDPRVKSTLMNRLNDTSISTREAVVDLIGTHILQAQSEMNAATKVESESMVKTEPGFTPAPAPASSASASASSASDEISKRFSLDADYFRFVLNSLNDPGISVKKKVVKVLRDLCLQDRPHPRIIDMCAALIGCVRDNEESMQSLSVTIIYEMWFDRSSSKIQNRFQSKATKAMKDEPMMYDQDSVISTASPFTPQFQQQVQLIVGVVSRLAGSAGTVSSGYDVDALTDILLLLLEQEATLSKSSSAPGEMTSLTGLKMNLLKLSREKRKRQQARVTTQSSAATSLSQAFTNADKPSKRRAPSIIEDPTSIRRVCEDMVKVIVDLLVTCSNDATPSTTVASSNPSPIPPVTRLSCIQSLHLFSQVEPSLLLPHVVTLQPYLSMMAPKPPVDPSANAPKKTPAQLQAEAQTAKVATANDTSSVLLLLEIFREVLYFLDSPATSSLSRHLVDCLSKIKQDTVFAQRLLQNLKEIATETSQPVLIKAAIPTLAVLCEKLFPSDICIKTAKAFVGFLWATQSEARKINATHARALIGTGLIVKHTDIDDHYAKLNSHLQPGDPARTSFWSDVYKNCMENFPNFKTNAELVRKSQWMQDAAKPHGVADPVFALYKLYLRALSTVPPAVPGGAPTVRPDGTKQAYCLQGIIAMFSRKPTLIPQSKEVIDICLSPNGSPEIQRQALRSLREFLQNEDRRLQRSQREDRVKDKAKKQKHQRSTSKSSMFDDDEGDEDEDETDDTAAESGPSTPASTSKGAKSWVDSTIDASDFLPPMVSMCEKYVYALAVSVHPAVRAEALQFMHVFLHQAVTNPIDAMPSIIAELTDRQVMAQKHAVNTVNTIIAEKKEYLRFMEQRFPDGIRLSFELQTRLPGFNFDPLHRTNLNRSTPDEPVFDRTPTEGLAIAYQLIKKSVGSRKAFCKMIALDLCSVSHIGIFARQPAEASPEAPMSLDASPVKPLEPHPSLNARAASTGSIPGAASPVEPSTPAGGSQTEDYPVFVPPVFERAATPRLPPMSMQQSMASPSSMSSISDASPPSGSRPANPLAFLAYVAQLCTSLPFEDDEPLQLCAHLSKTINTHGATLQAQMQQTIVSLKRLNGEVIDENEAEDASVQLAQPMETGGTQATSATPAQSKSELLASLELQCESAMAITILIQFRQWLQKSYELAGQFDSWNLSALNTSASSAAADGSTSFASRPSATRVTKKFDLPLHFNTLPLDQEQAVHIMQAQTKNAATPQGSQRKVAGKTAPGKAAHSRNQSAPVLSPTTSIIPPLAQVQFAHFHSCMEREAVFLAMKAPKRGHKRGATTGGIPDEHQAKKQKPSSAAVSKKKAPRKRKRRFAADSEDEEETDESDEGDEFESDEAPKRKKPTASRAKSHRAKKPKMSVVEEEDSGGEEEEEYEEPMEEGENE